MNLLKLQKLVPKWPKWLRKCLLEATFKSFKVKSGLRFALGPLVSSESFCSVFLGSTEPKIPKFRYFRFGRTLPLPKPDI